LRNSRKIARFEHPYNPVRPLPTHADASARAPQTLARIDVALPRPRCPSRFRLRRPRHRPRPPRLPPGAPRTRCRRAKELCPGPGRCPLCLFLCPFLPANPGLFATRS